MTKAKDRFVAFAVRISILGRHTLTRFPSISWMSISCCVLNDLIQRLEWLFISHSFLNDYSQFHTVSHEFMYWHDFIHSLECWFHMLSWTISRSVTNDYLCHEWLFVSQRTICATWCIAWLLVTISHSVTMSYNGYSWFHTVTRFHIHVVSWMWLFMWCHAILCVYSNFQMSEYSHNCIGVTCLYV